MEEEEELITNKLIKKLDRLKKDKEQILQQVEQEEELLTNTLHKKLQKLKNEKLMIESQLEQDKKYIINRLQRQYELVVAEKKYVADHDLMFYVVVLCVGSLIHLISFINVQIDTI